MILCCATLARMTIQPQIPLALCPPDPTIKLRALQRNDAALLWRGLWRFRTAEKCIELVERVLRAEARGRGYAVVALDDVTGDIIGFGQIISWVRCAEISDLLVEPAQRERGIGTAMIQYLSRRAHELNSACVEIGAARSNPRALALYRRLGFVDAYEIPLDLGRGVEPIVYLRLNHHRLTE